MSQRGSMPKASEQVADRFHLMQNLRENIEREMTSVRRRLQRFAVTCAKSRNIGSPTGTNLLRIKFLKPRLLASRVCGLAF